MVNSVMKRLGIFTNVGLALRTVVKITWPGTTGELPANAQQILARVCLCVTKSADRHTDDPGFSHPLDSVE